jgi:hypothetical protein
MARRTEDSYGMITPQGGDFATEYLKYQLDYNWSNSPVVGGKLQLRSNGCSNRWCRNTKIQFKTGSSSSNYDAHFQGSDGSTSMFITPQMRSRVRETLEAKIRDGKASIGVTLASMNQTGKMVANRLQQVDSFFQKREEYTLRHQKRLKKKFQRTEATASTILEGQFGWLPLVGEVHALAGSAFEKAFPPTCVTSRYQTAFNMQSENGWHTYEGMACITCAAFLQVQNPNKLLAQRLGASNPLEVAWDLAPWSFLVSMFTNIGSIFAGVTTLDGLTLSNTSTTETVSYLRNTSTGVGTGSNIAKIKYRTLDLPPYALRFKAPSLSWSTASILCSLVAQRASRIYRLLT